MTEAEKYKHVVDATAKAMIEVNPSASTLRDLIVDLPDIVQFSLAMRLIVDSVRSTESARQYEELLKSMREKRGANLN